MGTKKVASNAGRNAQVTDIRDPKQVDGLSKRVLAYARRYARVMTWWLGEAGGLAKGNTIEDVVCKAMVSLYGPVDPDARVRRQWDPVKYPEPFVYLMLFVKTELRNLSVSKENRRSERDVEVDAIFTLDDAEALMLEVENDAAQKVRVNRAYELLIEEIGDDQQLSQLHDEMLKGLLKPQLLAESLCMSVKDVNNLKKRMSNAGQRALARLQKELNHV